MVYPEGTDAITPLQDVIKQALVADDTGWTPLPIGGGFSDGRVEIRRVNHTVTITASLQWGTASNGNTLCNIPAEFRPGSVLWFPWGTNGSTLGRQAQVSTGGAVSLYWASQAPTENNYIRFTQTWLAG